MSLGHLSFSRAHILWSQQFWLTSTKHYHKDLGKICSANKWYTKNTYNCHDHDPHIYTPCLSRGYQSMPKPTISAYDNYAKHMLVYLSNPSHRPRLILTVFWCCTFGALRGLFPLYVSVVVLLSLSLSSGVTLPWLRSSFSPHFSLTVDSITSLQLLSFAIVLHFPPTLSRSQRSPPITWASLPSFPPLLSGPANFSCPIFSTWLAHFNLLLTKGSSIIIIIFTSVQTVRWGGGGMTWTYAFLMLKNNDKNDVPTYRSLAHPHTRER